MSLLRGRKPLRIVHLFPELLNLYGDRGNIATLAQRARWRGLDVEICPMSASAAGTPIAADIIFIGGGPDHMQVGVATALAKMEGSLAIAISEGAALLAVCGGFQNLGDGYRSSLVGNLPGPGLFDAWTMATNGTPRLVGGVVVELESGSPIAVQGRASAAAAGFAGQEDTIVGFENHSGRTFLGHRVQALGRVGVGHGNNGVDGGEGVIALPGESGLAGLRVGTYLHGPLLPRNPHLADFILASVLTRHGMTELPALPDSAEWAAHAAFADRWHAAPNVFARSRASRSRPSPDRLQAIYSPLQAPPVALRPGRRLASGSSDGMRLRSATPRPALRPGPEDDTCGS